MPRRQQDRMLNTSLATNKTNKTDKTLSTLKFQYVNISRMFYKCVIGTT